MIFTSILIFSTDLRQNQGHLLLAVGQHLLRYLSHVDLWQDEHSETIFVKVKRTGIWRVTLFSSKACLL
ncbi:hypothetical protein ABFA07_021694 [Porites harrisoni]